MKLTKTALNAIKRLHPGKVYYSKKNRVYILLNCLGEEDHFVKGKDLVKDSQSAEWLTYSEDAVRLRGPF